MGLVIYQLIPLLALALHFVLVFTSTINPARRKYTLISLAIALVTALAVYGFLLDNWSIAAVCTLVGLLSFQGQDDRPSVVFITLLLLSLMVLAATQFLSVHLSFLLISFVFVSLNLAREKDFKITRHIFLILSLLLSVLYLLIDFSAVQWINPSFILADTIVSSEIFYLDYASDLRLAIMGALLLGLIVGQDQSDLSKNQFALGSLMIVLSTDILMIEKNYYPAVGFCLVGFAFFKDLGFLRGVAHSVLSSTLMTSSTILFMGLLGATEARPIVFSAFLFLVMASVCQTLITKKLAYACFALIKNLLLFLLFSYLSIDTTFKIFAVISAGICLLGFLQALQVLVVLFEKEEALR